MPGTNFSFIFLLLLGLGYVQSSTVAVTNQFLSENSFVNCSVFDPTFSCSFADGQSRVKLFCLDGLCWSPLHLATKFSPNPSSLTEVIDCTSHLSDPAKCNEDCVLTNSSCDGDTNFCATRNCSSAASCFCQSFRGDFLPYVSEPLDPRTGLYKDFCCQHNDSSSDSENSHGKRALNSVTVNPSNPDQKCYLSINGSEYLNLICTTSDYKIVNVGFESGAIFEGFNGSTYSMDVSRMCVSGVNLTVSIVSTSLIMTVGSATCPTTSQLVPHLFCRGWRYYLHPSCLTYLEILSLISISISVIFIIKCMLPGVAAIGRKIFWAIGSIFCIFPAMYNLPRSQMARDIGSAGERVSKVKNYIFNPAQTVLPTVSPNSSPEVYRANRKIANSIANNMDNRDTRFVNVSLEDSEDEVPVKMGQTKPITSFLSKSDRELMNSGLMPMQGDYRDDPDYKRLKRQYPNAAESMLLDFMRMSSKSKFLTIAIVLFFVCSAMGQDSCTQGFSITASNQVSCSGNAPFRTCSVQLSTLGVLPYVGAALCYDFVDSVTGTVVYKVRVAYADHTRYFLLRRLYTTPEVTASVSTAEGCFGAVKCTLSDYSECVGVNPNDPTAAGVITNTLATSNPGVTGCTRSAGGTQVGCPTNADTCSFYRVYYKSTGSWWYVNQPYASQETPSLLLTVTTPNDLSPNKTTSYTIVGSGNTFVTSDSKFTLTTIGNTNVGTVILNGDGVMTETGGSSTNPKAYLTPVCALNSPRAGTVGEFQSASISTISAGGVNSFIFDPKVSTLTFSSHASSLLVPRSATSSTLLTNTTYLPKVINGDTYTYDANFNRLTATVLTPGPLTIGLKNTGALVANFLYNLACPKISSASSIGGCFSCASGAFVTISAQSVCSLGSGIIVISDPAIVPATNSVALQANVLISYRIYFQSPKKDVSFSLCLKSGPLNSPDNTDCIIISGRLDSPSLVLNNSFSGGGGSNPTQPIEANNGTISIFDKLKDFARRVQNFMESSSGRAVKILLIIVGVIVIICTIAILILKTKGHVILQNTPQGKGYKALAMILKSMSVVPAESSKKQT